MSFIDYFEKLHKSGLIDDDELKEFHFQYDSLSDEHRIELDKEYAAKDAQAEIEEKLYQKNYDSLSFFQKLSIRFGGFIGWMFAMCICTAIGVIWMEITGKFSLYIYLGSLAGYSYGKKYLQDKYIDRLKNKSDIIKK